MEVGLAVSRHTATVNSGPRGYTVLVRNSHKCQIQKHKLVAIDWLSTAHWRDIAWFHVYLEDALLAPRVRDLGNAFVDKQT